LTRLPGTALRAGLLAVLTLAPTLAQAAAQQGAGGRDDALVVKVQPRSGAEVTRIWRLAEHVLSPHDPRLAPHTLVVTRAGLEELRAAGIRADVEPMALPDLLDDAAARRRSPVPRTEGRLALFGDWFSTVPALEGVEGHLVELARAAGGRAQVLTIGHSVQGRPIQALRLVPSLTPVASILVTGTQHAREWASTMVTLGLADGLARQAEQDPRVGWLLERVEVIVVPVVNVDGYVATHQGLRLQRKNLAPGCGVDLNRNWDVAFGAGVPGAGCDEENYPGPAPFSEPETRAVRDLVASLGDRLRLFLDYHAPSEQVMIPLAFTRERPADYDKSRSWAELYARTLRGLYDTWHPARDAYDLAQGQGGGAIDWFRLNRCQSFAVELRDGRELGGFQLPADQIIPSLEENWVAFLALAEEVARDAGAGDPALIVGRTARQPFSGGGGCSVGGAPRGGALLLLATVGLLLSGPGRRSRGRTGRGCRSGRRRSGHGRSDRRRWGPRR
jgi:hypothetical protein